MHLPWNRVLNLQTRTNLPSGNVLFHWTEKRYSATSGWPFSTAADDDNMIGLNENNDNMYVHSIYLTVISVGGILAIYSLYKIVTILRDRHR